MSETLRSRVFWTLALVVSQLLQGVAQQELRVEPLRETVSFAWAMRETLCRTAEDALYAPISHEPGQSCLPPFALCTSGAQCCSGACYEFRCQ